MLTAMQQQQAMIQHEKNIKKIKSKSKSKK
jgi:hypothetical protein